MFMCSDGGYIIVMKEKAFKGCRRWTNEIAWSISILWQSLLVKDKATYTKRFIHTPYVNSTFTSLKYNLITYSSRHVVFNAFVPCHWYVAAGILTHQIKQPFFTFLRQYFLGSNAILWLCNNWALWLVISRVTLGESGFCTPQRGERSLWMILFITLYCWTMLNWECPAAQCYINPLL